MLNHDPDARRRFISNLRGLADYLDTWTGLPVPAYGYNIMVIANDIDDGGCEQVDRLAALMRSPIVDEVASDGFYSTHRHFGDITYTITALSSSAMERYYAAKAAYDNA